jgi:hypothetical protein
VRPLSNILGQTAQATFAHSCPHSGPGPSPALARTCRVIHKIPGTNTPFVGTWYTRQHLGVRVHSVVRHAVFRLTASRSSSHPEPPEPQAARRTKYAGYPTVSHQNPESRGGSDTPPTPRPVPPTPTPPRPEIAPQIESYAVEPWDRTAKSADCSAWRSSTGIRASIAIHRARRRRIRSRSR